MFTVLTFYQFTPLGAAQLPGLRQQLLALCAQHGVRGTVLLATEGVNATLAGPPEGMAAVLRFLREGPFPGLEVKESWADAPPFKRLKVKIKREIIRLDAPEADPTARVGTYVPAADWNALITQPGVTLLDTRNTYEVEAGTFDGAIDPRIATFTEFKKYVAEHLSPATHPKVAMFCTGGIRCEKASAYLLAHGFEQVYHLKGGILKYLEDVPADQSRWKGDCFVFDEREGVGHGLQPRKKP
jgi:UPF0176 protein